MHVWNVLQAACWKYRMQKLSRKTPSVHHCTTLLGYIFTTRACIDNWKKTSHLPHNMVKTSPTNGWDRLASLGHPSKFQQVSCLGFVTAATSLSGSQPNFARCLAVSCVATLYIHFLQLLPRNGILPGAKFSLLLLAVGSVTARHSSSGHEPNFVALSTGRHLYSAGRPSRWALAHILVCCVLNVTVDTCYVLAVYYYCCYDNNF